MGGIVTAIFQTLRISANSSVDITALGNIRDSAYWVSQDVRMAQTTDLIDGAPPVNSLTLDWSSWYIGSNGLLASAAHHSQYQLVGDKIKRTYDYGSPRNVGSYISAIAFSRQVQMIYVTITSSLKSTSGTVGSKTYRMYLQPKVGLQN